MIDSRFQTVRVGDLEKKRKGETQRSYYTLDVGGNFHFSMFIE